MTPGGHFYLKLFHDFMERRSQAVFILLYRNKFDHIDKSKLSSLSLQTSLGIWKMRLPLLCLSDWEDPVALERFPHPAPCHAFVLQIRSSAVVIQQCSQQPQDSDKTIEAVFYAGKSQLV